MDQVCSRNSQLVTTISLHLVSLLSFLRLVLRIRADDPAAICQLGIKFGCSVADGYQLLSTARELELEVVGVR